MGLLLATYGLQLGFQAVVSFFFMKVWDCCSCTILVALARFEPSGQEKCLFEAAQQLLDVVSCQVNYTFPPFSPSSAGTGQKDGAGGGDRQRLDGWRFHLKMRPRTLRCVCVFRWKKYRTKKEPCKH